MYISTPSRCTLTSLSHIHRVPPGMVCKWQGHVVSANTFASSSPKSRRMDGGDNVCGHGQREGRSDGTHQLICHISFWHARLCLPPGTFLGDWRLESKLKSMTLSWSVLWLWVFFVRVVVVVVVRRCIMSACLLVSHDYTVLCLMYHVSPKRKQAHMWSCPFAIRASGYYANRSKAGCLYERHEHRHDGGGGRGRGIERSNSSLGLCLLLLVSIHPSYSAPSFSLSNPKRGVSFYTRERTHTHTLATKN